PHLLLPRRGPALRRPAQQLRRLVPGGAGVDLALPAARCACAVVAVGRSADSVRRAAGARALPLDPGVQSVSDVLDRRIVARPARLHALRARGSALPLASAERDATRRGGPMMTRWMVLIPLLAAAPALALTGREVMDTAQKKNGFSTWHDRTMSGTM